MEDQQETYPKEVDGTTRYRCNVCHHVFLKETTGWYPTTRCIRCEQTASSFTEEDEQTGLPPIASINIGSGRIDSITGVGYDRVTGREVGITEKGERVPIEKTYYDTKRDPHGWRAVGKKVKGEQQGRLPADWKK